MDADAEYGHHHHHHTTAIVCIVAAGDGADPGTILTSPEGPAPNSFPTMPLEVQIASLGLYQLKGVHGFLRLFTLESSAVAAAVAALPTSTSSGPAAAASKNFCVQPDSFYRESITITVLKAVPLYEEAEHMQAQLQAAEATARAAHDSAWSMRPTLESAS